jgi:hypothetical protein
MHALLLKLSQLALPFASFFNLLGEAASCPPICPASPWLSPPAAKISIPVYHPE